MRGSGYEPHGGNCQQESAKHKSSLSQNGFGAPGATYAGSSMSLVRYTFTRCPSRMVIVGSLLRNRFITWSVACDVASPTPPAITTVRLPSPLPRPALPRYWESPLMRPTAAAAPNVDR